MDAKEKYRPWYPELVTWMARTGLTAKEIASELGVATATLYRWRDRYPDLATAMDDGRDLADARAEAALYSRVVGIREKVTVLDRKGEAVSVDRIVNPDVTACIFWLCNRRREVWKSVNRVEHTGADGGPIEVSDADRKRAEEILTAEILAAAETITRDASKD
jgi:transposase-like protein